MSLMNGFLLLAAALVAPSACAQVPHNSCASAHYKIIPLPLRPARINNSGVIAGTIEDHHPAIWTEKDGLREIELPPGFSGADPLGINRAGDLVGSTTRQVSDQPFAFQYSQGKFSLLSEEHSKAFAINDAGDAAGQNAENLVMWRKQNALPLGGCCGGIARAINSRGEIVGQVNDKEGRYSAFLWDAAHGLRSIAPPDAARSNALAINEAGHVLVQSFTPNAVFLRQSGKFVPVHLSADMASQPLALNDCDIIVGEFGFASDFNHAFIWDQKNGFRDLNKLADGGSDWVLETALDINDSGEIVGIGDRGSNQDVGYLLVPQQESKPAKTAK
jgi:uncharacterized membrane protein